MNGLAIVNFFYQKKLSKTKFKRIIEMLKTDFLVKLESQKAIGPKVQ